MLSIFARTPCCRLSAQSAKLMQCQQQQLRARGWRTIKDRYKQQPRATTAPKQTPVKEALPYQQDLIAVRPAKDLWKALGFTVAVGAVTFAAAAIADDQRVRRKWRKMFLEMPYATLSDFQRLTDGTKCTYTLIALNALVMLVWRVRPIQLFMWRYFTNSFASKALCSPMVLSAFSHAGFLHLALNMYVLSTFAPISIDRHFGVDQFLAFYITAASMSSLVGLMHKCFMSSNRRALGASGAILALLIYTCMKMPEARLHIVFLPYFDFSAQSAVAGIIAFDLVCLLLGFQIFDHAAHLGGSLFGLLYAAYGDRLVWQNYRNFVLRCCNRSSSGPSDGSDRRARRPGLQ